MQQQQTQLEAILCVRNVELARQAVRFESDIYYQGGKRLAGDSGYPSLSRYPSIINKRNASNVQQKQTTLVP
jgi:hypothetical protein